MHRLAHPAVTLAAAVAVLCCGPSRPRAGYHPYDTPPRDDGAADADAPGDDGDGDGDWRDAADAVEDGSGEVAWPSEVEDNDPFLGAPQRLDAPATIEGMVAAPAGGRPDVDGFVVAARAGRILRATVSPSGGGQLRAAVRILRLDADGEPEWERASVSSQRGSAAYRDAFIPEDGDYVVAVTDRANLSDAPSAWTGGSAYRYVLSVTLLPPAGVPLGPLPAERSAAINPAGTVQVFDLSSAAAPWVEVALRATEGSSYDALLAVFDRTAGSVVAEDDDSGGGYDALVRFPAPASPLWVVADQARAEGGTPRFVLSARGVDPVSEAEPNGGAADANAIPSLPWTVAGVIGAPSADRDGRVLEDRDVFRFDGVAGRSYALSATRAGGGSAIDPFVSAMRQPWPGASRPVLEHPLAFADDSPVRGDVDARVVVTLVTGGPAYVEVRDARNVAAERSGLAPTAGGDGFRYALRVEEVPPPAPAPLGVLATSLGRDDAVGVGGEPDRFAFLVPARIPAAVVLGDTSSSAGAFLPAAFVAPAGSRDVLAFLAAPPGGSAVSHVFFGGLAEYEIVVADRLGSGSPAFAYRLDIRRRAASVIPEAPGDNDAPATAQPLAWVDGQDGVVVEGTLDGPGRTAVDAIDVFRIERPAGERLVAFTGPGAGAPLDTVLVVRRADGSEIASNDDVPGATAAFSAVEFDAGDGGPLHVEVSTWHDLGAGGYSLFVGAP